MPARLPQKAPKAVTVPTRDLGVMSAMIEKMLTENP